MVITALIFCSCSNDDVVNLQSFERVMLPFPDNSHFKVETESLPVQPVQVRISNGDVYVSDFYSMTIFRFNSNWELINYIGAGSGKGPGEMQIITDFIITGDTVIVADSRSFKLHYFKTDGTFLYQREVRERPLRVASANGIANLLVIGGKGLFISDSLHSRTEMKGSYAQFSDRQQRNIISYDGSLISDGDRILYLPRYFSAWYRLDPANYSYATGGNLPDGQELDFKNENNRISTAPKHLRLNYTGGVLKHDTLIVASYDKGIMGKNDEIIERWYMYMDYFDASSGDYLYSHRFPGWFNSLDMEGNRMVIESRGNLFDITFTDRPVKQ